MEGSKSAHLPPMHNEQNPSTLVMTSDVKEDALSALVALGYKPVQAAKVINAVYKDGISSEELIREALRSMA